MWQLASPGEDHAPPKHIAHQYPIEESFLRLWAIPVVDSDISLQDPMEYNAVFE